MNSLYPFLYLPLAGMSVLLLLASVKLLKECRGYLPAKRRRFVGLLVVLALFISGFAVMLISHGQKFELAMLLIMAASLINIFVMRMKTIIS